MRRALCLVALIGGGALGCGAPAVTPTEPGVRVGERGIDALSLLSETATRAERAGAESLEPLGAQVMIEGEQLGSFVEVAADRCMLAFAEAGSSVSDVDMFVYDDAGNHLASDEAPEPRAAVLLCPPHPRRVYVAARVMGGHGVLAVGVMAVEPAKAEAAGAAAGAKVGQDTGKLAVWPGLERKIRERRAGLGSRWEDVRRAALPLDPSAHAALSVPIEANRCLDILVTPSEEVQGIDAVVVDRGGRVIARGRPPGKDRAFVLCSPVDDTLTVMVRPRLSAGIAAVVVGRSPVGSATDLARAQWVDVVGPLLPLPQAIKRHDEALASLGRARKLASAEVAVGAARAIELALEAGCVRLDVVGGAPLGPFEASLWRADGKRVARTRSRERATLFHCGEQSQVRLEVVAVERGGPFAVMARRAASPPAALDGRPLAAARALGRLETLAGPIAPALGAATVVEIVDVPADTRVARPLPPNGQCVALVAATAGDAHGVELRIVRGDDDATTTRGHQVTAERWCGGDAIRAEFAVASGAAQVLWITHPLDEARD